MASLTSMSSVRIDSSLCSMTERNEIYFVAIVSALTWKIGLWLQNRPKMLTKMMKGSMMSDCWKTALQSRLFTV